MPRSALPGKALINSMTSYRLKLDYRGNDSQMLTDTHVA